MAGMARCSWGARFTRRTGHTRCSRYTGLARLDRFNWCRGQTWYRRLGWENGLNGANGIDGINGIDGAPGADGGFDPTLCYTQTDLGGGVYRFFKNKRRRYSTGIYKYLKKDYVIL